MPKLDPSKAKQKSKMKKHLQKIKSAKEDDPEFYNKAVRRRNRAQRKYRRKKRVGDDPIKILKRLKKILLYIDFYPGRSSLAKTLIESGNLDHQLRIYRGANEDQNAMDNANIMDLVQEYAELCQKFKIYSSTACSQEVQLTLHGKIVHFPFPKDIEDQDNVFDFQYNLIVIKHGNIYHATFKKIIPSETFIHQITAIYPKRTENPHPLNIVTFAKFLEQYGLTENELNQAVVP